MENADSGTQLLLACNPETLFASWFYTKNQAATPIPKSFPVKTLIRGKALKQPLHLFFQMNDESTIEITEVLFKLLI